MLIALILHLVGTASLAVDIDNVLPVCGEMGLQATRTIDTLCRTEGGIWKRVVFHENVFGWQELNQYGKIWSDRFTGPVDYTQALQACTDRGGYVPRLAEFRGVLARGGISALALAAHWQYWTGGNFAPSPLKTVEAVSELQADQAWRSTVREALSLGAATHELRCVKIPELF